MQLDDISISASLGPDIANKRIMQDEKCIVDKLIKDEVVKIYARYIRNLCKTHAY